MTKKIDDKIKPEYIFWRKRVEGQLRHTMNEHPEWFNFSDDEVKERCVRSIAKRIIGEIVAGIITGDKQPESCNSGCDQAEEDAVQLGSAESGGGSGTRSAAPSSGEMDAFEKGLQVAHEKRVSDWIHCEGREECSTREICTWFWNAATAASAEHADRLKIGSGFSNSELLLRNSHGVWSGPVYEEIKVQVMEAASTEITLLTAERDKCGTGAGCCHMAATIDTQEEQINRLKAANKVLRDTISKINNLNPAWWMLSQCLIKADKIECGK